VLLRVRRKSKDTIRTLATDSDRRNTELGERRIRRLLDAIAEQAREGMEVVK